MWSDRSGSLSGCCAGSAEGGGASSRYLLPREALVSGCAAAGGLSSSTSVRNLIVRGRSPGEECAL